MKVKPGIEKIIEEKEKYLGLNFGLLTNSSGVTSKLEINLGKLLENGFKIKKLFGPEHGIWGAVADGEKVKDVIDPRFGLLVYSLYGEHLKPTQEMLEGLDGIIYDIQDVGLRYYTYIYTLGYVMEACREKGIKVIVLDRPNPLSGKVEGPVVRKGFESFVGGYGLVIRYGLTIGELARYLNEEFSMGADLEIIKMDGWRRDFYYDNTGLLWPTPSPNLPDLEHTILYTGMCLLEGVNVSVGRGTVHPFKYIGAPWINSKQLLETLNNFNHQGIEFRERTFIPFSAKYANELCYGLEFYITDREKAEPLKTALNLIHALIKLHPEDFQWDHVYHDSNGVNHFDRLIGNPDFKNLLQSGATGEELVESWRKEEKQFEELVQQYHLYR
ncbi:exo-beta-N-acetylmuramidase NamZ family protein [Kosmotoga pacifica]|uniref:DUF1343 domain-containing protein n=1 Tax=Kosmotoga pacifica TaxID=1330330 RepID=A0A0G2Z755_9BACT|nr:DUF1343 domain-containing protein [Kosmotoga pacifica]AKI97392.1 hypothetical protein IX53_05680 [Kosmotoga pacifica]